MPDAAALPQPSLVVLPFVDLSADRRDSHFADGITEDLITELARNRWLSVIARNSAFTYRSQPVDVKQISHQLGVRYVLEGSVRRSGERFGLLPSLLTRRRACTSGQSATIERLARYSRSRTRSCAA